jgi:hypothetical protein
MVVFFATKIVHHALPCSNRISRPHSCSDGAVLLKHLESFHPGFHPALSRTLKEGASPENAELFCSSVQLRPLKHEKQEHRRSPFPLAVHRSSPNAPIPCKQRFDL